MKKTIDGDLFSDLLCIWAIDHVHNLLLYQFQVLCISRWCSANDIVQLDSIILFANNWTSIMSVGEFDKDRIFLHKSLNVLTTNSNDSLMVLIWNVKR